jgi:hypothetical protein
MLTSSISTYVSVLAGYRYILYLTHIHSTQFSGLEVGMKEEMAGSIKPVCQRGKKGILAPK